MNQEPLKYTCKSGRTYLVTEKRAEPCFLGAGWVFTNINLNIPTWRQYLEQCDAELKYDQFNGQYYSY